MLDSKHVIHFQFALFIEVDRFHTNTGHLLLFGPLASTICFVLSQCA
jgi:hypothetical protein